MARITCVPAPIADEVDSTITRNVLRGFVTDGLTSRYCAAMAGVSDGAVALRAERLPIKTYTTADGLARNTVEAIVRDSRGFLWICTAKGLSRFDGYQFTNYGTDEGLPSRSVSAFLETDEGIIG